MKLTPLFLTAALVTVSSAGAQDEPFRPRFHFTPQKNWMNDPNGMLYHDGEWHLFYQYNPFGNTWGHMSWGHAVSRDLVKWEHLPIALMEEDGIMIFSGSAVVDAKNTSGFGKDGAVPFVAIYTGHQNGRQDQRIAYSNDRGRTWTKYPGNPVLDLKMADFRDPKVFWHEATSRWMMVVALPTEKKVHFYASPNLKEWKYAGEFGPAGSTAGIWECPDLFPVEVEGGGKKWVLIVNMSPGAPAGGSGCQYFVGEFDGAKFTPEPLPASAAEFVPEGKVLADFENGYGDWKAEGESFGAGPASGTMANQQPVSGFRGKGLVNSYMRGDRTEGTLTSPPFEITDNFLNFLVGGGGHKDQTCVNLRVDGKVVRTQTGHRDEKLTWASWDVRELRGKTAEIQAVDKHTGGWGHISFDHVLLAAEPARSATGDVRWADWGPDFYAAVSWFGVPESDGRRLWLAWMSSWPYAGDTPTSPWRSAMTVPRQLTLRQTPEGLRLIQQPARELEKLRQPGPRTFGGGTFAQAAAWLAEQKDLPALLEVEIVFTGAKDSAAAAIHLHTAENEVTSVLCAPAGGKISVDRRRSGKVDFHPAFTGIHEAPLRLVDGGFDVRLLLDTSSLEVFAQKGETSLSELIYPKAGTRTLSLTADGGTGPAVSRLVIHELK